MQRFLPQGHLQLAMKPLLLNVEVFPESEKLGREVQLETKQEVPLV